MLALKRVVTVAVMLYLLLALLFLLAPAVRTSVMGISSSLSVLEQERQFFFVLCIIGVLLLGLQLVTENLDSVLLRRAVSQHETKINELKARLYDHQQRTTAPPVQGSRTIDGRISSLPVTENRPSNLGSTDSRPTAPGL